MMSVLSQCSTTLNGTSFGNFTSQCEFASLHKTTIWSVEKKTSVEMF